MDMEWGYGDENPAVINPSQLDCSQWARIIKAAGMEGMIVGTKHHDGFCLWPFSETEHSVKNSPWRDGNGDLLRELRDACLDAKLLAFHSSGVNRWSKTQYAH